MRVSRCSAGTPTVDCVALHTRVGARLGRWVVRWDGKRISRAFTTKDWAAAMAFTNALSAAAEAADHHPDVHITRWRHVRVELYTHAAGGVTEADLALAETAEALVRRFEVLPASRAGEPGMLAAIQARLGDFECPRAAGVVARYLERVTDGERSTLTARYPAGSEERAEWFAQHTGMLRLSADEVAAVLARWMPGRVDPPPPAR